MPFAVAGGAIAAVGAVGGAVIASQGAQSAAKTQAGAAAAATAAEQSQFAQTTANFAPFLNAGTNALTAYQQALGLLPPAGTQQPGVGGFPGATATTLNPSSNPGQQVIIGYGSNGDGSESGGSGQGAPIYGPAPGAPQAAPAPTAGPYTGPPNTQGFQGSPGYAFQVNQGLNALNNQASATGGVVSGNTLKALQSFGQGQANTTWNQYLAQLSGLVSSGQNAAGNLGTVGTNVANQIGSNLIGAGNATAAGQVASANAFSGLANNSAIQNLLTSGASGLFSGGGTNAGSFSIGDGSFP